MGGVYSTQKLHHILLSRSRTVWRHTTSQACISCNYSSCTVLTGSIPSLMFHMDSPDDATLSHSSERNYSALIAFRSFLLKAIESRSVTKHYHPHAHKMQTQSECYEMFELSVTGDQSGNPLHHAVWVRSRRKIWSFYGQGDGNQRGPFLSI